MNKAMDIKTFSSDGFDAKEWINQAYSASDKQGDKEEFVNNTISTLQLYMQQLNHALEETTSQVLSGLPRLIREAGSAETGARGLQGRMSSLQEAIEDAQKAAGQPLLTLQRTDRLKSKLELARQGLREADKWAALAGNLESILESGDTTDLTGITKLMEDMNDCLEVLSGASDHEDKRLQLEGLRNRFEALLSPVVVEAFTGRQTERCRQLWWAFGAMNRLPALSVYRARCEAAALRSRISIGSTRSASQLRDLHAALLRHAAHQLEWSPQACPGEATLPWLLRLQAPLLSERGQGGPDSPEDLQQLLAACDHYAAEVASTITREQGKKGTVTDEDLLEFSRAIYTPVRNGLANLGTILSAAMAEDLGPMPSVDVNSSEAGTVLQLRVSRGSRTLRVRVAQGRALSRGAAHRHLVYAAQWLIDELCMGWSSVKELPGCLSLLRGFTHLQQLVTEATQLLEEAKLEDSKLSPPALGRSTWLEVLHSEGDLPCPAISPPHMLHTQLHSTARHLLLGPIAQHLDGVENLKGWLDNEQYASDLPDFSLSPQEYVTQIGQYLLTLPQHLEPMLDRGELSASEEDPAYHFLNEICNSACEMVAAKIDSIKKLDSLGLRKCSTDKAYLTSVLEELGAGSEGLQLLTDALMRKQAADE